MSTDPAPMRARSFTAAAEPMRRYRKRRREGMQLVRIPLHVTEIDDLIRMGRLNEAQRQDAQALQAAVLGLVHLALDEMRDCWLRSIAIGPSLRVTGWRGGHRPTRRAFAP
jgi:hypothetical protein